ncbi:MAG: bifunctional ornithine acetyltransferase/N-acetylglutamate synthase, partial [Mariprofundaceae bacterium]
MAVNPPEQAPPLPVVGFRVGVASCGVKSPELKGERHDLALIVADHPCHAAGVFTQNRFRAACVDLCEATLAGHGESIRCIIANAGNANAGLGRQERIWARELIEAGAAAAGCAPEAVLSASTGVIGEPFPIDRIRAGLSEATASLTPDGWPAAANAIRTTDTFAKWASRQAGEWTITGIAKGSGMIHPNMATMLAFVATDAPIARQDLQPMLKRAVDRSFNSISVDGDTSTNDTVYLLASGIGRGLPPLDGAALDAFERALTELCGELARLIVRDGEGVSKFVTIEVRGAA